MKTDENYLKELSRALRRHAIPEAEIEQTIREVQETGNNTDRPLTEEFGSPQDYVKALYPETKPKQYYLFTLCGLILAAIGFILLTVYFRNLGTDGTAQSLWKFAALIVIPIGMAIDFTRYATA
ncbi:hypothetical protein [Corynebacterium casei]|uniref:hypothetical protein n=1 Tax=Corynebacterium casei TaxID=160386 RepID=UPI003BB80A94